MWREPRLGALSFPRVCPARQSAIIRHKVILSLICLILRGSFVAVGGQGQDAKHRLVIFARGPENQPKSLTRAIGTLRISNYCGTTVKSHGGVCEQIGSDFMVVSSAGEESQLQAEEALIELNKNLADNGMSEFEFFLEPAFMTELQSDVTLQQQADAPYNLARLTSPDRDPLKTVYEYVTTGDAVNVYIVDTNIRSDDPEFAHRPGRGRSGSRVRSGYTAFDVEQQCYGHGTHVAGVVGGLSYGVAKDVTLWEVGVQPCGDVGNTGYFLAGLDWIIANAQYPAIVTTSLLALGRPTHLGDKVTQVLEAGIPFVAAAGNQRSDACGYYPPAVPGVLAIANSDYADRKNLRSNWGPCVALFAPGTGVPSADSDNPGGVRLLTGTSQAAPHVAGAIAQFLQRVPAATVSQVQDRILETAALDVIDKPGPGTPNRLLQVDLSSWDERVPNELPGFSGTPLLAITPGDRITVDAFASAQPSSDALRRLLQVSLFNSSQPQSYQVAVQAVSGAVDSAAVAPQEWLRLNSSQGTLHWEHPTFISLGFSTTDLAPGTYQAQVTVSMTSTTPSSRALLVVLRVFCQRLAEPATRKSGKLQSSTITAERPESWGPGVPGREEGILYLQTQVQFSHPIVDEDAITGVPVLTGCIETVGAGSMLEELTPEESSPLCSTFRLRVSRPAGDVWYGGNKVCVSVRERCLRDIYGSFFPEQTLCETYDAAPQVKLFPAFMAFASDEGLTTAAHEVLLVAAFTEPVSGVEVGSFSVNVDGVGEAQIAKVTPVASSSTAYHVLLSLPKQYYGSVSVSLSPSNIKDGAGNALVSASELSFKRVEVAVMEHGAYELATHMEL